MIPRRHTILLTLAMILLFGGFLRFYRIDGYGLWSDEFVTLQLAQNASYTSLIRDCFVIPQPIPPLYFLLTKFFVNLLGPNEISLRLLSVLSGTLTIILIYFLGEELFDSTTGIYAALLFAIQPTQLVFAQNARAYAFCLLLCAASVWFMIKWMRSHKIGHAAGFVLASALLFYSHYVFAPLLLILNIYFLLVWSFKKNRHGQSAPSWLRWIGLQSLCGLLLLPLAGQMWKVLQSRQALNWSSHHPEWQDFFRFVNWQAVGYSLLPALVLGAIVLAIFCLLLKRKSRPAKFSSLNKAENFDPEINSQDLSSRRSPFPFLLILLWAFLPPVLFGLLYLTTGLNLFVENYLIIASVPTSLLLPASAFRLPGMNFWRTRWWQISRRFPPYAKNHRSIFFADQFPSHLFLILLVFFTVRDGPWYVFHQRGLFSQGVPGGNEWRETLTNLQTAPFQAPSFFFQSPFIESNRLDFQANHRLHSYLSAPLESFYLANPVRDFTLLPVFWDLETSAYRQFRSEIYQNILAHPDFLILSTRLFWNDFSAWLRQESEGKIEIQLINSYQSTGALMLNRVRLVPHPPAMQP
jgi:uncharacterized membrane protein